MAVRIEKKGKVWTVIHSRAEARNAMDPESADALVAAFEEFDRDKEAGAMHELARELAQRIETAKLELYRQETEEDPIWRDIDEKQLNLPRL